MKKLSILFLTLLGLMQTMNAMAKESYSVTKVHQAITQESGWLNTSRALTAEDLKGRIILLDFWTYCCINCIHVIPELIEVEKKFGHKLTVIGVHSAKFDNEKDTANIRSAMIRYGVEHPVVNDAKFRIWQSFGIRAWPSLVLIGPEGNIVKAYSGEGNKDAIIDDAEELLDSYKTINETPLPIELEVTKSPKTILNYPGKLIYVEQFEDAPALFVTDSSNHRILGLRLDGTIFKTIGSGTRGLLDGDLASARFNEPQGLLYKDSILYVADTKNHALREINFKTGHVKTLAGNGNRGTERSVKNKKAASAELASPWDLAFYPSQNEIAIAMAGTHQLWTYNITGETVSVLAGNGRESIDDGEYPYNSLSQPSGLSVYNNKLYFVDSETSSLRVMENGKVTTLIGTGLFDFGFKDGKQGEALMQHALGVYADQTGVYIADSYNHSIRHYDVRTGLLSTLAGDGKNGQGGVNLKDARFNEPSGIIRVGKEFYVTDTNNQQIRILDIEKNTVRALNVMPAGLDTAESPQDDLPNLLEMPDVKVGAAKEVQLNIALQKGWKINADAPSWFTLFKNNKAVASLNAEAIKKKAAVLPALEAGAEYRLQGTFYYCEDKPNSLCLIASVDEKFTPIPSESHFTIVINPVYP